MRKGNPPEPPDWFGCGRKITLESWDAFTKARQAYYTKVDELEAQGAPIDPLLGHPRPEMEGK